MPVTLRGQRVKKSLISHSQTNPIEKNDLFVLPNGSLVRPKYFPCSYDSVSFSNLCAEYE